LDLSINHPGFTQSDFDLAVKNLLIRLYSKNLKGYVAKLLEFNKLFKLIMVPYLGYDEPTLVQMWNQIPIVERQRVFDVFDNNMTNPQDRQLNNEISSRLQYVLFSSS
jgi:hypothetical protein